MKEKRLKKASERSITVTFLLGGADVPALGEKNSRFTDEWGNPDEGTSPDFSTEPSLDLKSGKKGDSKETNIIRKAHYLIWKPSHLSGRERAPPLRLNALR